MIEILNMIAIVSFTLMMLCYLGFMTLEIIKACRNKEYSMLVWIVGMLMFAIFAISSAFIFVLEVIAK